MLRRVLVVAAVVLLAGGGLLTGRSALGASAAAEPGAVACKLTGTAQLSPGVTTLPKATSYTFTGSLALCTGVVSAGTVSASGAGNLGCSEGSSSGTATVAWNNGLTTGVSFATHDVGSLVVVTGIVTSGEFTGVIGVA